MSTKKLQNIQQKICGYQSNAAGFNVNPLKYDFFNTPKRSTSVSNQTLLKSSPSISNNTAIANS